MLYYERKLEKTGCDLIIGVDEAGRGPLAGPVVAAALVLKTYKFENRIDDSKKLTSIARGKAFLELIEKSYFGIGIVNEKIIDRINILVASRIAMEHAVWDLLGKIQVSHKHLHILVDGNMNLELGLPTTSIIKGDTKSMSIAGASIIAKVTRDRIMGIYDKVYPQYGFLKHKGYPTESHRDALKKFGPTAIHRFTFDGV